MANAVICRTRMPDGSLSDAGCGLGTECCAVCDAANPCPAGQRCCSGRCVTGQCCVASDCVDQTCKSKECTNNTCVYTNQGSGTGGSGCADPLQCCNGTCCPAGQKCCGNTCIDVNRCCVSGVPDNCPADSSRCCGGECILPMECCTNNQIGCPQDQTCVVHEVQGPDCCPTPNACGPRCRTTPCSDLCGICNAQTGGCESVCEPFVESCCFGECKVGNGEACTQDADCCAGLDEICGRTTPSGVKICCREDDRLCSSNAECCSGRCVDSFCEEA